MKSLRSSLRMPPAPRPEGGRKAGHRRKRIGEKVAAIMPGPSAAKRVLGNMVDHWSVETGRCYPGHELTMYRLQMNRKTVERSVMWLERKQLIFVQRRAGHTSEYSINWAKLEAMCHAYEATVNGPDRNVATDTDNKAPTPNKNVATTPNKNVATTPPDGPDNNVALTQGTHENLTLGANGQRSFLLPLEGGKSEEAKETDKSGIATKSDTVAAIAAIQNEDLRAVLEAYHANIMAKRARAGNDPV